MKTLITRELIKAIWIALALLIPSSSVAAYPSDPNNAALLYYQAYLCYEGLDETIQDMIDDLSNGEIEPNKQVRKYIDDCQTAIELAAAAANIPNCDWGLKYSDGFSMKMVHLAQARYLNRLIVADARIRMADGAYRKAIDRYLTARKMARHTGDKTIISFLVSVAVSRLADSCIQDILGDMTEDLETLTSLKSQMGFIAIKPLSVQTALKTEEILRLEHLEKPTEMLVGQPFQDADESFVKMNKDYYKKHMSSIQEILGSPMSYATAYAKFKELSGKAEKDAAENPAAILAGRMAPRLFSIFGHEVRTGTFFNAIRAAVEVYIIKAKSGRLPDELPANLPKDLFSGEDFEYERNKGGFVLRCRGKDLDKDEICQYEFKVAK